MRNRHFILLDVLILCVTPALALMLRVDGVQALRNYALALLVYITYNNLLSVVQAWIAQSRVDFVTGSWGVHAPMLALLLALFYRR